MSDHQWQTVNCEGADWQTSRFCLVKHGSVDSNDSDEDILVENSRQPHSIQTVNCEGADWQTSRFRLVKHGSVDSNDSDEDILVENSRQPHSIQAQDKFGPSEKIGEVFGGLYVQQSTAEEQPQLAQQDQYQLIDRMRSKHNLKVCKDCKR